jgi:2-C-methyl-D-erythritol 4-phosphate cytidylyltransferase
MNRTMAILLAAGSGKRFGHDQAKQFFRIGQRTILEHCLDRFEAHSGIEGIILVENPDYHDLTADLIKTNKYEKIVTVLSGGDTRQESSRTGVLAVPDAVENVLIHDVARPLVSKEIIDRLIKSLERYPAAAPAIPSADTLIEVNRDLLIRNIPDRETIMRVQTPQAFKLGVIRKAHEWALRTGIENSPDDCSLILKAGLADIRVVEGSEFNFKVTYPSDLGVVGAMPNRIAVEGEDS